MTGLAEWKLLVPKGSAWDLGGSLGTTLSTNARTAIPTLAHCGRRPGWLAPRTGGYCVDNSMHHMHSAFTPPPKLAATLVNATPFNFFARPLCTPTCPIPVHLIKNAYLFPLYRALSGLLRARLALPGVSIHLDIASPASNYGHLYTDWMEPLDLALAKPLQGCQHGAMQE